MKSPRQIIREVVRGKCHQALDSSVNEDDQWQGGFNGAFFSEAEFLFSGSRNWGVERRNDVEAAKGVKDDITS